jgi:RNA polymerase sigma-70 factor (ECF subfamily)
MIEERIGKTVTGQFGSRIRVMDPGSEPGAQGNVGVSERWEDTLPIERAIQGDRDAMARVWEGTRRWVAAVILAHKSRTTDLEDLLQQVALKVCTKIHEVRDPGAFKPWLRTVAINTARADGRKTTRRRFGMLRLAGSTRTERDEEHWRGMALTDDAKRVLDAAIALPEHYREPVLMRCLHAMSTKQIADVLGLPETTVETRVARGRRMLRETLEHAKNQSDDSALDTKSGTSAVIGAGGAR